MHRVRVQGAVAEPHEHRQRLEIMVHIHMDEAKESADPKEKLGFIRLPDFVAKLIQ